MAEYGIPTTLTTPLGTVAFNNGSPGYRLTGREGADMGTIRTTVDDIPQRDGAVVHDAFEGELVEVLEGVITLDPAAAEAAALSTRRQMEDNLRSRLKSIMRTDGTLTWTPSGGTPRQRTVRLFERVLIRGGLVKEFHIGLVAGDPLAYSTTEQSAATPAVALGTGHWGPPPYLWLFTYSGNLATVIVTNAGTAPSYPKVRLHGPFTGGSAMNLATGEFVILPSLTVTVGNYVEIDMRAETILLNGVTPMNSHLDMAQSTFWALQPGAPNIIEMTIGSGGDGVNTKATVIWRNAFDG